MFLIRKLSYKENNKNGLLASFNFSPEELENLREDLETFKKAVKEDPFDIPAHLKLAKALKNHNKFEESVRVYLKITHLDPEHVEAFLQQGIIFSLEKNLIEAIKIFNKVLRLDSKNQEAHRRLCLAYQTQENYPKVIEHGNKLFQAGVNDSMICSTLGDAYFKLENYKEAIKYYNIVISNNPSDSSAYTRVGNAYEKSGDIEEAIKSFKKVAEFDPTDRKSYMNLAFLYKRQENYSEAKENLLTAIELDESNEDPIIYYNLGEVCFKLGEEEEAISYFTKTNEMNPEDYNTCIYLGTMLTKMENYDKGIKYLQRAIQINPQKVQTYSDIANTYLEQGTPLEAIKYLNQALELNPREVLTLYNLSRAFSAQNDHEKAIKYLNVVLQINPEYAVAYNDLGVMCLDQRNFEEAIKYFDKAIEVNPGSCIFYNNRGKAYYKQGKSDEATKDLNQAISLDPNYFFAYYNLGNCYYDQGNLEESLKNFSLVIKLNPQDVLTYCRRGQIYSELGKGEEALDDFNKAYELLQLGKLGRKSLNISAKNRDFIDKVLQEERSELLGKLAETQQVAVDIDDFLDCLGQRRNTMQDEINKFNELKISIRKTTNRAIKDLQQQSNNNQTITERFNEMQKELQELKELNVKILSKMMEQDNNLKIAGVYDKVYIKQQFANLSLESPELSKYCKTFYWTLINYLSAYRALQTNLINGNLECNSNVKEKVFEMAIKKTVSYAKTIVLGVPFAGQALSLIDSLIDSIFIIVKRRKLNDRVRIINDVISFNNDSGMVLEEDISIMCAKTALSIVQKNKEEIIDMCLKNKSPQTFLESAKAKIIQLKELVLPSLHLGNCNAAHLAVLDATNLLSYVYIHSKEIMEALEPIEVQFAEIVTEKKWSNFDIRPLTLEEEELLDNDSQKKTKSKTTKGLKKKKVQSPIKQRKTSNEFKRKTKSVEPWQSSSKKTDSSDCNLF